MNRNSASKKSIYGVVGVTALAFGVAGVGCATEEPGSDDTTSGGSAGKSAQTAGSSGTGTSGAGSGSIAGAGGSTSSGGNAGKAGSSTTAGTAGSGGGGVGGAGSGGAGTGGAGPAGSGGLGGAGASAGGGGPFGGGGAGGDAGTGGLAGASGGGSGGADPSGGAGGKGGGGKGGGASGSGGSGGGSAGGGSCEKGQVSGDEVVIMGESFYAIAPQYIQNVIQDNARAAGSLDANESYRNVAVSGQNMNYIANNEWTAATQGGASVKVVIMDGGGIDCLGSSNGSPCSSCPGTFETLLGKMATAGVEDVIYTRYPEPGNPPGSNASLKMCLDGTMPNMQEVCEGSTAPRCHWLDLRPVWMNGDTTDGLHPTQSGGDHVGDLIWSEMVRLCLAQ